jgi:hypothetical protein
MPSAYARPPFASPEDNNLEHDPTPKNQAIYGPSISPGYAIAAYAGMPRALPVGVTQAHMNFLDPNNSLFCISHAMSSAGQAYKQRRGCIIRNRQRASTFLICDSGGYQIASGRLNINSDKDRLAILRWMEGNADVAMTLDVPTGPLRRPGYRYESFGDCLGATLNHLEFFQKHRVPGKIRLLNVLHGNDKVQTDQWYDAVKQYDFEGWAFAGAMRHNIGLFCRRILKMADERQLEGKDWIHVLGTANLETAVLLTALQRAINRYGYNKKLRISFDTSTPFRMMRFGTVYTLPKLERSRMTMPTIKAPYAEEHVGSSLRWPWPSPLGDRMTLGDFCVRTARKGVFRDQQSDFYLAHHNLAALCFGIATANRVFDGQTVSGQHSVGELVGDAVAAIDEVFRSNSLHTLAQHRNTFSRLRYGVEPEDDDEDRAFIDL